MEPRVVVAKLLLLKLLLAKVSIPGAVVLPKVVSLMLPTRWNYNRQHLCWMI
jgi:hypothetical protein